VRRRSVPVRGIRYIVRLLQRAPYRESPVYPINRICHLERSSNLVMHIRIPWGTFVLCALLPRVVLERCVDDSLPLAMYSD
jgi:hypothetical protein